MAHSKHRKKTLRKSQKQRLINRAERSRMRSTVKAARTAIAGDAGDEAVASAMNAAAKELDKAGGKGLIHKNKAARMKSRLAKARNRAAAS